MTDPKARRLPARVFQWWAALAVVLVISTGGFALAYLHASAATKKAQHTADCVNNILGARAPLTNADHANERQKIVDQTVATSDEKAGLRVALNPAMAPAARLAGIRLYQRGVTEFQKSLADWKSRDDVIAAAKARAPLGRC